MSVDPTWVVSNATGRLAERVVECTETAQYIPIIPPRTDDVADDFRVQVRVPDVEFNHQDVARAYRNGVRKTFLGVYIYSGGSAVFSADGHSTVLLAQMHNPHWRRPGGGCIPLPTFGMRIPRKCIVFQEIRAHVEIHQPEQPEREIDANCLITVATSVFPAGVAHIILRYLRIRTRGSVALRYTGHMCEDPWASKLESAQAYMMAFMLQRFEFPINGTQTTQRFSMNSRHPAMLQLVYFVERRGENDWEDPELLDIVQQSQLWQCGRPVTAVLPSSHTSHVDKKRHGLAPAVCHTITFVTPSAFKADAAKRTQALETIDNPMVHLEIQTPLLATPHRIRIYGLMACTLAVVDGVYGVTRQGMIPQKIEDPIPPRFR